MNSVTKRSFFVPSTCQLYVLYRNNSLFHYKRAPHCVYMYYNFLQRKEDLTFQNRCRITSIINDTILKKKIKETTKRNKNK